MSIPDRLGRLGKAYVGAIKEKIESELAEREAAQSELEESTVPRQGKAVPPPPQSELSDVDSLMRRAEEKIAAARRELDARKEVAPPPTTSVSATPAAGSAADTNPLAGDYRTLGLASGSGIGEVQAAYEDLARRLDPKRFPAGSEDQEKAGRLLERVNLAYENLRRSLNPTENRFAKLEL